MRKKAIDNSLSSMLEDITKSLPEGVDVKILKDLKKAVNCNDKEMAVNAISHIDKVMGKIKEKSVLNNRIDELNKKKERLENTDINELIKDIEDRYSDMLNECYPKIEIGCVSLYPSNVLKTMDPIVYNMGLSEYNDYLASEINHLPEWDDIERQISDIEEAVKDTIGEIEELDEEISEMIYWGIYYKG